MLGDRRVNNPRLLKLTNKAVDMRIYSDRLQHVADELLRSLDYVEVGDVLKGEVGSAGKYFDSTFDAIELLESNRPKEGKATKFHLAFLEWSTVSIRIAPVMGLRRVQIEFPQWDGASQQKVSETNETLFELTRRQLVAKDRLESELVNLGKHFHEVLSQLGTDDFFDKLIGLMNRPTPGWLQRRYDASTQDLQVVVAAQNKRSQ